MWDAVFVLVWCWKFHELLLDFFINVHVHTLEKVKPT